MGHPIHLPTGEKLYQLPADKFHYLKVLDTVAFLTGSLNGWVQTAINFYLGNIVFPQLGIKIDPNKEEIDFNVGDGTIRIRRIDKKNLPQIVKPTEAGQEALEAIKSGKAKEEEAKLAEAIKRK